MSVDPRVLQLVEQILDSGCDPAEACADFPELLDDVRDRLDRVRAVEAELGSIFPPSNGPATPALGRRRVTLPPTRLPRIPGYEVQSLLGHGGMGVVYKARHVGLNRTVALKMLLSGAYASPSELARFTREAEVIANLRHAHVVQVYDIGDHEGRPYFTMEFLEGGHLGERLAGAPQPARQAAETVATLAGAVEAAHRDGIVHRDLKPANVLLTADGTPKVSDFGLARAVAPGADVQGLTLSGARVGTPSYMAPEQANGHRGGPAVGPATDVYALGAILYEMLTGRPPFRAETASETERQLISQDPVSPSRLNGKVPRDLETVCLKCLRKEPEKRYASAAELEADLRRFLAGEPVTARPVGRLERIAVWVRRHPVATTAIAGVAALACVLVAGGVWLTLQRNEQRHAVEEDLRDVTQLQQQARWPAARAALDRAEARLGAGVAAASSAPDLREQIARARHDLDLVIALDTIRLTRATHGDGDASYVARTDRAYRDVFASEGLVDSPDDRPARAAAALRASAIRPAWVAAVDDWIACATDRQRREWLVDVARRADPDPMGWRAKVLDLKAWDDREALAAMARGVPVDGEPLSMLLALGERLRGAGGEAAPFLKRVQRDHPDDFWANLTLGNALLFRAPMEAGGYYRAALAARPEAAVSYCAVGDALRLQGAFDAALDYYAKSVRCDPRYARAYTNVGLCLQNQGMLDEAIGNYRKAIGLDPDYPWTHFELANALRDTYRFDEAAEQYRATLALDRTITRASDGIRCVMVRQGRAEAAWDAWRRAIAADGRDLDDWIGYGQFSLFLGHRDEYERARRQLLDRFGDSTDPAVAERTSRACLLLPLEGEDLRRAVALASRAAAAKGTVEPRYYPYFAFVNGLAEYRQGHLGAAVALMKGDASKMSGPGAKLVLATALQREGDARGARRSLAEAASRLDWSAVAADRRDHWIWHVLRREAEQAALPNLPAFLAATYRPADNDERLALVPACQFGRRYVAGAQLYEEAFAGDAALANSAVNGHRVNAARFAAMAGVGAGDAEALSAEQKARWRAQARNWLRAEVDAGAGHEAVVKRLAAALREPDFAGIRDAAEVSKLSGEERGQCDALWRDVGDCVAGARDARE